jgi:hypothetical protein
MGGGVVTACRDRLGERSQFPLIRTGACGSVEQEPYRVLKVDWILAVIILTASVVAFLFISGKDSQAGASALLYCDGRLIESYDLSQDQVVTQQVGEHQLRLEINTGRIRVVDSDCPRQICKHAGWISGQNQTIVCVPDRVLIEIKGLAGSSGLDAVSY